MIVIYFFDQDLRSGRYDARKKRVRGGHLCISDIFFVKTDVMPFENVSFVLPNCRASRQGKKFICRLLADAEIYDRRLDRGEVISSMLCYAVFTFYMFPRAACG